MVCIATRFRNFSTFESMFGKANLCMWDFSGCLKVITSLPPADSGPELSYHSLDDQMNLLTKVRVFVGI